MLKPISQLCRKKNDLVKQVNVLKSENNESLNKFEQIKKTMLMMNFGTMTLNQILLMGRMKKDHKGLDFREESS